MYIGGVRIYLSYGGNIAQYAMLVCVGHIDWWLQLIHMFLYYGSLYTSDYILWRVTPKNNSDFIDFQIEDNMHANASFSFLQTINIQIREKTR